ncbi:hypothetical protein F5Y18DRAFT_6339 [Xylariaceae sp. FL1019]|nr:hypothetical protein F5Y18DRAFT_6339 [Xylariaceae sp. FL1019]
MIADWVEVGLRWYSAIADVTDRHTKRHRAMKYGLHGGLLACLISLTPLSVSVGGCRVVITELVEWHVRHDDTRAVHTLISEPKNNKLLSKYKHTNVGTGDPGPKSKSRGSRFVTETFFITPGTNFESWSSKSSLHKGSAEDPHQRDCQGRLQSKGGPSNFYSLPWYPSLYVERCPCGVAMGHMEAEDPMGDFSNRLLGSGSSSEKTAETGSQSLNHDIGSTDRGPDRGTDRDSEPM